MKLSDFDFELPEDRIALRPAVPRTSAKLLVSEAGQIKDLTVADLAAQFRAGDRLVVNDTKVIPARLTGVRRRLEAEAKIEVTLLSPTADGAWMALVKPLRKLKEGEVVVFSERLSAELVGREEDQAKLRFNLVGDNFDEALAEAGNMPLPPYIAARRAADQQDNADYQPIWAANSGAVAAPTASLHFDDEVLAALEARGVGITRVTLHVGAGTFLPVKVDDISEHKMHSEWGQVSEEAAADILATKAAGGRVIPVGTTALRLIETAARATGQIAAWTGDTDIFITPGFQFNVADGLVTNFHLPKSTLMMLVSALVGVEHVRQIYAHAVAENYRFFSYGDASLLLPSN